MPSASLSDEALSKLASGPLREYKQVVFHCHLSQQRGPKAAGQYAQAYKSANQDLGDPQEILVLRGGFSEFQDKFKVRNPAPLSPFLRATDFSIPHT